jgi:iron complex outermembrane recepter protein
MHPSSLKKLVSKFQISVFPKSAGVLSAGLLATSFLQAQENTASSSPAPAAPEEAVALDELVISARNRTEKAQDVPVSASTISASRLEQESLITFADFATKLPNVTFFAPNPRQANISIRGIGKNSSNESSEASVGLIIDDVYLLLPGNAAGDYVDLERIEVLRGPQGTLKGKNTTLGVVNVVTKAPSFTPAAWVEATGGSFETKQLKGSFTGPLIDDKLAYRASFNYRLAEGDLENPVQGGTVNDTDRFSGKLQFLGTPTPDFSARLILDYALANEKQIFNPIVVADPATYSNGASRGLTNSGRYARDYFQNILAWTPSDNDRDTFFANNNRGVRTERQGASVNLNKEIGEWAITSITSKNKFSFEPGNDSDPYDITTAGGSVFSDQLSQELRLSSPLDRPVDYQVGLFFLQAENETTPPPGNGFGQDAGAYYASIGQYNTLNSNAAGRHPAE